MRWNLYCSFCYIFDNVLFIKKEIKKISYFDVYGGHFHKYLDYEIMIKNNKIKDFYLKDLKYFRENKICQLIDCSLIDDILKKSENLPKL